MTRHLDAELKLNDWDALILHYLGLDHIGHLAGPYSQLMPAKLQEMDDIIQKLHMDMKLQVEHIFSQTLRIVLSCMHHTIK